MNHKTHPLRVALEKTAMLFKESGLSYTDDSTHLSEYIAKQLGMQEDNGRVVLEVKGLIDCGRWVFNPKDAEMLLSEYDRNFRNSSGKSVINIPKRRLKPWQEAELLENIQQAQELCNTAAHNYTEAQRTGNIKAQELFFEELNKANEIFKEAQQIDYNQLKIDRAEALINQEAQNNEAIKALYNDFNQQYEHRFIHDVFKIFKLEPTKNVRLFQSMIFAKSLKELNQTVPEYLEALVAEFTSEYMAHKKEYYTKANWPKRISYRKQNVKSLSQRRLDAKEKSIDLIKKSEKQIIKLLEKLK